MIAHLVGGPGHGRDMRITDPPNRIIKTVEAPPTLEGCLRAPIFPDWKEHEYRLLHHDARLAVYRWIAPTADATWEFHVTIPRGQGYAAQAKLDNLHEMSDAKATRMVGWEFDEGTLCVRGISRVEGPADGIAAAEVSAEVQKIIDSEFADYAVSTVAVQVGD